MNDNPPIVSKAMTRALIVEDSPTQAQHLQLLLESEGFAVVVARDGQDGLQRLQAGRFDIVLSDVVMPGLTGYELCREAKAQAATRDVPIILLTTLRDPWDIVEGLAVGADNFITKPFQREELLGRIHSILANRALREQTKFKLGIEMELLGRRVCVTSDKQQILDLLISTFEELVRTKRREEESQRFQEVLRESQHFLQSTLDALPLGILVLNHDGAVIAANAAWESFDRGAALLGAPCPVGANYLELCESAQGGHAGELRSAAAGIRTMISAGPTGRCEQEIACRGPTEPRWFVVNVTRIGEASPAQVVVAHEEVTPRKRSEELLARSEECYRRLFHDALTGNFLAKPDGTIVACNPAFGDMFGFASVAEAQSVGMAALFPSPDVWPSLLETLRTQEQVELREMVLRHRAGKPIQAVANIAGTFDSQRELVEIKGYLFDVTERKKLEQQLRQSQKMEAVGQLAGGVAHDFNNLLTIVLGYSSCALEQLTPQDRWHEEFSTIEATAERGAALTRQLLAFSRKQVMEPKHIDLGATVKDMQQMLRRMIGEHITLHLQTAPDLCPVYADPNMIGQVIVNLAVNARDAMPSGGTLTIQTSNVLLDASSVLGSSGLEPGPHVLMSVADTGCGMDQEVQAHLFEPFFTTKEKGKGTGLGLSTVHGIVKQSGGAIVVYSEVGLGTTFKIYLPAAPCPSQALPTSAPREELLQASGTILLVEDDENLRHMVYKALRQQGYEVLIATSGREAVTVYDHGAAEIDLLITDVVMPQMSGCELAKTLAGCGRDLPVLYMSGYSVEFIANQHELDGSAAFLMKPFTVRQLLCAVRAALQRTPPAAVERDQGAPTSV